MNKLAEFMRIASYEEKRALAEQAGTSAEYLVHLAKGYGGRAPNVRLAVKIETASRELRKVNRKLPIVTCEDLAGAVVEND